MNFLLVFDLRMNTPQRQVRFYDSPSVIAPPHSSALLFWASDKLAVTPGPISWQTHIECTFFLCSIGSAHGQTSCFCSDFPRSLCCSVITEQKWNKDHCGTSPGCRGRCCGSTAAFHIKPKILGPRYCLMCLYHVQESSILLTGVNTLSKISDNCLPSPVHCLSSARPDGRSTVNHSFSCIFTSSWKRCML